MSSPHKSANEQQFGCTVRYTLHCITSEVIRKQS